MALASGVSSSTDPMPIEEEGSSIDAPGLNYFVFGLFFIFGGITSLNDVIIPKLKELFTLSWTEAMLVQFCFFAAYAIVGIPGAKLVKKLGYMRGAVAGLCTMMVGCLLFIPASQTATYAIFLFALFILASGVVIVQVVANPLISLLGPARTTHSRLTFAQAFNSLGTTIFPIVGAAIILGSLAGITFVLLLAADTDVNDWWRNACADEPRLGEIPFETRQVANRDWVHETQRQFQPFAVGQHLWVGPSWLTPPADVAAHGVAITLDPGMAFGTGSHATTQLCLEQLLFAMADRPVARVLDYGCGSGILAIAAARLGATEVVALDIDPLAIDASMRNAKDNHVKLALVLADDAVEGQFDIVMANILSQPLKVLAPLLAARVKPGGALLMSGILERQAEEIIDAYRPHTAHLSAPSVLAARDGWVCVGCVASATPVPPTSLS
jgi:ribosomal protein L11 methyltransferase